MAGNKFNVGVIGYGMSAKIFHIPFIKHSPYFNLHSIVQRTPKEGDSAAEDYPDLQHYRDAKQLFADPNVHLVVITTPPDTHFNLSKDALEAGKHVLTEKPFVPTSAMAEELNAIAKKNRRLLCVYQNRRWDYDFLLVKHLLSEKTLGRIVEFNTHYDRYSTPSPASASWRSKVGIPQGGSTALSLATHIVDQVYMLFGMPAEVHGRLLDQHTGKAEYFSPNTLAAELMYPDGMLVNVRISAVSAEITQPRFWVRGSQGSFSKIGVDPQEDQLQAGLTPASADFGKEDLTSMRLTLVKDGAMEKGQIPELEPETYKEFYASLGRALESGNETDLPAHPAEARDVLRIFEAIMESAKEGRNVILQ